MIRKKVTNVLGWTGVILILAAYILNTFHVLDAGSLWYHLLNVAGALGIVIETSAKKDWEPAVLNIVWGIVALIALLRL